MLKAFVPRDSVIRNKYKYIARFIIHLCVKSETDLRGVQTNFKHAARTYFKAK